MDIMTVSSADVRAAQILTGTTLSLFILAGVVPGLRGYATRIRIVIMVLYFVAAAGFMLRLLVR
jgi:hypothetical protein